MGYQNEKTPAGETTGVNGVSDGGALNHRQHTTVNGGGGKAQSVAERLFENGGENLLDAGLRAAKRGWRIFPCNGKKEPLTSHGFKDATTDEAAIRAWARNSPGALWGRALEASVLVIDLDMKHGKNGIREFEKLQSCKPEQFDAPRVATATGGIHIYADATGRDFKNTADKIALGVDTKTDGGYVIIPSGDGSYRWLTDPDTPKPPAPTWTEVALQQPADFVPSAGARAFQGWSPFGDAILAGACETIANCPGGSQAITLNRRSYVVGQYVGGGLIERDVAIEALIAAGMCMVNVDHKNPWTAKQVDKKVRDAVHDGMKKPLDGEEPFRLMEEVNRRYAENPQLYRDVEEFLTALDAQADEWADAGHSQTVELPWFTKPQEQVRPEKAEPPHEEPKQERRQEEPGQKGEQEQPRTGAATSAPPFVETQWPVLNGDAMHGLAGDVVRAIEPHTESDPVALLVQFITYFGNAIGRHSYYLVESDRHYPNLFTVLVGQSSKSRKGTAAGRIRDIMACAEPEWANDCISSGLSSGEGVIWRVRDPIYRMKKGRLELEDEGVLDHRLLLDERELFQALTVMKREGNTLSRVIRDAWDRGKLQTITKHNPACSTDAHISIVGHITEDELRQNLDHTAMMNGVANRFVYALVRRARLLPHGGGDLDGGIKAQLATALRNALQRARTFGRITMKQPWRNGRRSMRSYRTGSLGCAGLLADVPKLRLSDLH